MNVRVDWRLQMRRFGHALESRLGLVGIAGVALLAVATGLGLYTPPLERSTQELHATIDRTRELVEASQRQRVHRVDSPQRVADLREMIPVVDQANADLRAIFDAAQKSRVELAKGEYALAAVDDASRLQRFEVVLPVRERYITIKTFVAEVLNALPHASLAELRIERSAASVEMLDARLRFTLFYRVSAT